MLPTQLTVGHLSWTFQVWNQLCLRSDSFHGRYANWTNIYVSCYVNLCHVYMCIHIQFPWLSWFTGGPRKYWSTVCQVHKHVSAVFDLASKWSSATTCSNLEEYRKINRSSQVHGQLYPLPLFRVSIGIAHGIYVNLRQARFRHTCGPYTQLYLEFLNSQKWSFLSGIKGSQVPRIASSAIARLHTAATSTLLPFPHRAATLQQRPNARPCRQGSWKSDFWVS